jgi:predicted NAD-dependent protein-ADP-ribosyltransferase YbiA (DUF1768 family)
MVEASKDMIWRCGLELAAAETWEGEGWPGTNLLGQAIMDVRAQFVEGREEQAEEFEG